MSIVKLKSMPLLRLRLRLCLALSVAIGLVGCYSDAYRELYLGDNLYYSFDDEVVDFQNDGSVEGFSNLYPVIISNKNTRAQHDYVFLHQQRLDSFYFKGVAFSNKEYDSRLFISLLDVTNSFFGYTNDGLTNNLLKIYYYKVLENFISISNEGHLYFTNRGTLATGEWYVRGEISNQGLGLRIDQVFKRAKLVNQKFELE